MNTGTEFIDLQIRLSQLEKRLETMTPHKDASVTASVVDHVSALVGLREALTHRRWGIKLTWTLLLCAGIIGTCYYTVKTTVEYLTDPSATSIALYRPPTYDYPTLVLCPESWRDPSITEALSLTDEAVTYSLGYFDRFAADRPFRDLDRARENFHTLYDNRKFDSLFDFYKNISFDLVPTETIQNFSQARVSAIYCNDWKKRSGMIMVNNAMCFAIELDPANGTLFRLWSNAPTVIVKVPKSDPNSTRTPQNWDVYLMPETGILQTNYPPMKLEAYSMSTLKMSIEKFVTLRNDRSTCLKSDEVSVGYSAERCTVTCLHWNFEKRLNCSLLPYDAEAAGDGANRTRRSPADYCNNFDLLPGRNVTFSEFINTMSFTMITPDERAKCMTECPFPCERLIYTSSVHSSAPIALAAVDFVETARRDNMTLIYIQIDHTAIWRGGIMTLAEVNTYSFATLLSNLVNHGLDVWENRKLLFGSTAGRIRWLDGHRDQEVHGDHTIVLIAWSLD